MTMHVKESVKEFVHDVKRRFSHHHKHKRGESASSTNTADTEDTTSTYSTAHSQPSTPEHSNPGSPAPSQPGTPESSRFGSFIRQRTPSTPSKKHHHNVLHKIRRPEGKRSRLFSTPSLPSGRKRTVSSSTHERGASETSQDGGSQLGDRDRDSTVQPPQLIVTGPESSTDRPESIHGTIDERRTLDSSKEGYTDILDIRSETGASESAVGEGESVHLSDSKHGSEHDIDHHSLSESARSESETDTQSHSDISGTLITAASGPSYHKKSVSESDSHYEEVDLRSVDNSDRSSSVHELTEESATSASYHTTELPASILAPIPEPASHPTSSGAPLIEPESDAIPTPIPTPAPAPIVQDHSMADAEEPVVPGPNPFVLDDSDEGTTSEGGSKDGGAEDEVTSPQEEEIALAQSLPSPAQSPAPAPAPAPPVNFNKPTPARPLSPSLPHHPQTIRSSTPAQPTRTTSGSPAPMYLPRLTAPSMFLPIPNTDPLSSLLTKYVTPERRPRRDVAGEYTGRDVHEMVMSNSWRALAKMARDRIVASDPEDLARILDLWSLRLSSLARLRLTNQASAECTNLFAVLNAVPPSSVPGSFPGSGSLPPSIPLPSSPAPPASLPLSPAGLGGLAQLPSTPGQKSSALPSGTAPRTVGAGANELTHPFELTVLHARVHYWAGDTLGYVDALSGILGRCKERAREEGRVVMQRRREREETRKGGEARKEKVGSDKDGQEDSKDDAETADESQEDEDDDDEGEEEEGEDEEVEEEQDDEILIAAEANLSMWLERAARVCLILASQLVEMKDYQAAITLLDPLCTHRAPPTFLPTPSPALHSALGRVYLLSGNLQKASEHFEVIASSGDEASKEVVTMNKALLSAAVGDWARAEEALSEVVGDEPGNITALNNLSVVLLSQGRIKEGIELLESALKASPSSVVVAEPFLFNLSTLYELRSATALEKKRDLLIEVAKWSGDGLKTTCLKMPSN